MRYVSYEGRTKSEAVDKMFMAAKMENRVKETMLIKTYPVEKPVWFGLRKETIWVATACIDDRRFLEKEKKTSSRRTESQEEPLFKDFSSNAVEQSESTIAESNRIFKQAMSQTESYQNSSRRSSNNVSAPSAGAATALLEKKNLEQEVESLKSYMEQLQGYIKDQFQEMKEGLLTNTRNAEIENKTKIMDDVKISLNNIEWAEDFLLEREFHPAVIKDVVEHLKARKNDLLIDKSQVLTAIRDFLKQNVNREEILIDNYSHGKNILFAGPTGVGKTVSIIKMAAHVAVIRQKGLRFISIDRYKVGADSQLKTYSDLMKAPFYPINKQEQFYELLDKETTDYTFIDTAGKSPKDTIVIKELSDWLKKTTKKFDVHLVVSATTKPKDLDLIINSYSCLNFSHIIATKLDETTCLGSIVSTLYQTKKPLSFITNGQEVPQDFEIANVDKLINDALK